ncbi:MAG: nucleotidyltransferase domain-containing protein [Bacteroidales bacterium]
MNFGLQDKTLAMIKSVMEKHPDVKDVMVYGSRAMGNYKEGSDVDLALLGEDIKQNTVLRIQQELEDLNTPYLFDVLAYNKLQDKSLKEHIDSIGTSIY